LLTRSQFDYVALGHVHRHQVLCDRPPILYPGSIERVDFSEEKEDKGFVLAYLERNNTRFEFCRLPVRPFRTISVDLSESEDPQATLLQALQPEIIQDAVVRLVSQVRSEQMDQIDNATLHAALEPAHSYTIYPELVSQLARPRLPQLGAGNTLAPLEALQTYLENREDLRELAPEMLHAARSLLSQEETQWLNPKLSPFSPESPTEPATPQDTQLRLL
jgi:exonuclease SbcD